MDVIFKVNVTISVRAPYDTSRSVLRQTIYDGLEIKGYMIPAEWELTAIAANVS